MRRLSVPAQSARLSLLLLAASLALAAAAILGAPMALVLACAGLTVALAAAGPLLLGRHLAAALGHLERRAVALAADGPVPPRAPSFPEAEAVGDALDRLADALSRRRREADESEDRYRALAEGLPALVWVLSHTGETLYQNRRAAEYTGVPALPNRADRVAIVHEADRPLVLQSRATAARERREYAIEVRLRRHDGTYRWHQISTVPIEIPVGAERQTHWLSTAIDVENLKEAETLQAHLNSELERRVDEATHQLREETAVRHKAERRLRQTQKMEAISRLTGGIAHDLNNKLMVISANIDSVTKHVKDQPALRRKLIAALVASDQAAALLSKLLAFARQRELQVQYIDIAEHLDSITSLLDRSFLSDSVNVRLTIPEDLWPVEVDPHELETAIVNLGVNARDAMAAGGTIQIEARNVRVRRGTLSDPEIAGDFVRIEITDSGVGIEAEQLEHVFEPFFTTKGSGRASGLGLSQVHGFARQLGGTVEIASTAGEGTTVALFIPRAHLPALTGAKPSPDDLVEDVAQPGDLGEILVVDDEVEVALALQGMLQESGYAAVTAIGADEAMQALRSRKPDLVLTDVTMPGTMDGVVLAREIRKLHPNLPVVLITGNPMVVAESSEFPLLSKPIASRDLHAALQRYLTAGDDDNVVPLFGGPPRRAPSV